jgi:hypothetical protein
LMGYHRVRIPSSSPTYSLSPLHHHLLMKCNPNSTQFLISYSERKRHGQVPQNHFTFYAQPQGYYAPGQQPHPQQQGTPYAEPPPMYNGEAPPGYFAPQGASKVSPNQQGMEMPQYGAPQGAVYGAPPQGPAYAAPPQGAQQSGVVGSDVEQGQSQQLPPRPQQAKAALRGMVDRFRR